MQKDKKRQEADQSYAIWMQKQHHNTLIKKEENRSKNILKSKIEAKAHAEKQKKRQESQ